MALVNVIGNGTYGVIPKVTIDRNNRHVHFEFNVFTSSDKTELIFSRDFSLHCLGLYKPVTSISKREPDGSEVNGDYFFVPNDVTTGDWSEYAGNFIQYMVNETQELVTDENGQQTLQTVIRTTKVKIEAYQGIILTAPDGNNYRINENKSLTRVIVGRTEDWANYFQYSVSTASGTNIVEQCYLWLKNTGLYPTAIDG